MYAYFDKRNVLCITLFYQFILFVCLHKPSDLVMGFYDPILLDIQTI